MAANGGSVANGRIVPAIPALAGAQSKASQRVGASWPFVLHGDFPCRKDRFIPLSLCQRSSHRLRTKLTSATPSCTSSNQSGRGQPFPRASTTAFQCALAILLTITWQRSMRLGSHRIPTGLNFCATRLHGRAGAIQSSPFAMLSAPFSKRFASATTLLAMNCALPRLCVPARWRRSSGLKRSIER